MATATGDIEMGTSFDVVSSEIGNRNLFSDYPGDIYQEIQVGDTIIEYDRFEENTLFASIYKVCDFCNNAVIAVAEKGDYF